MTKTVQDNEKLYLFFSQDNYFSREKLHNISCNKETFYSFIQTKQTPEQKEQLRKYLCNNVTDEQFTQLSEEIKKQLNSTFVYEKV